MSSASVSILATIEDVTTTLFDIEKYPEWSTSIKRAEVLERDSQGRVAKAKLTIDAGAMKDRVTLIYDWSAAPARLEFSLDEADLLTQMDGAYVINAIDTETTAVSYELNVAISMPLPAMMIRKAEKTTIDQVLAQLKAHLEG